MRQLRMKASTPTHFFIAKDQERSKDFYVRILGGKVIKAENPCYIKLANAWIILNSSGGPTPDKPEVLLQTPSDPNKVSSFLNLRVADICECYKQWGDKVFLTEPLDNHGWELRCYTRDPMDILSKLANTLNWHSTISKITTVNQADYRLVKPTPAIRPPKSGPQNRSVAI